MIPRELYTLGAVKFDVNQLADKLVAAKAIKQKAEQEAFEKYFTEGQKLTSTGVRAQDLPGFEQRRRNWQTFTIQNKDKITKDPYIRLQANELFNEAVNYIQRSKQATDKLNPVRDMTIDPTKRKSLNSERVMVDIALHERPLDDSNRKDIDINQAWYKPPVYDFDKDFNAVAQGQQKAFLRKIPNTFDPQLGTIQAEEGYLPNSVKQIATDYRRVVEADPEKLDYWERQSSDMDPARKIQLNQVFSRVFPNIQAEPDNPLLLAMATAAEKAESRKDVVPKTDVRYASGLIASRGGGSGKKPTGQIDLTTYRDVGNAKDVTDIFQGVKVTGLPKGESMLAKQVLYNKDKNQVTLTEWVGRDDEGNPIGGQTRTIPYNVFLQNIKTLNPQTDFSYIETLPEAKIGKTTPKKRKLY